MNFLKNNFCTIFSMVVLFSLVMMGDVSAQATGTQSVFTEAIRKGTELFTNAKMVIFVVGGFGLIALAFQAIFGKIKWAWFATLAFGLAIIAAAGAIIKYAANTNSALSGQNSFQDSLGSGQGMGN